MATQKARFPTALKTSLIHFLNGPYPSQTLFLFACSCRNELRNTPTNSITATVEVYPPRNWNIPSGRITVELKLLTRLRLDPFTIDKRPLVEKRGIVPRTFSGSVMKAVFSSRKTTPVIVAILTQLHLHHRQ